MNLKQQSGLNAYLLVLKKSKLEWPRPVETIFSDPQGHLTTLFFEGLDRNSNSFRL